MENRSIILIFYLLAFVIENPTARCFDKRPEAVEAWFEKLPKLKEKMARFHFYSHVFGGENQTAFTVAEAKITATSPTQFGLIQMVDYPVQVGPYPDSMIIGRVQGMAGRSSFEEISEFITVNILFTEGEYKGSTLSLLAREPTHEEYWEMPIVGGSGAFRLARGICTGHTIGFNAASNDSVFELTSTVLYYDDDHQG